MDPKPQAAESAQFENSLERLLKEAAEGEAARPYFYKELLESLVYVCPHAPVFPSEKSEDSYTLKLAAIPYEGIDYVPFYTTPQRVPAGSRCSQIPAKVFLEVTKGSYLVLNPGQVPLKTFTPEEVTRLLSGALLAPEKQFEIKSNAPRLIGQPPVKPTRLLEQLAKHFAGNPAVQRAWLGWYHHPQVEEKPGYLLALEVRSGTDFKELAGLVSVVLREVGTGGQYCDIVDYTGRGLTRYFCNQKPFYRAPLLRRIFG